MSLAGRELGTLLAKLQAHALTAGHADRDRAVTALVTVCAVAGPVVRCAGQADLAAAAARHGYDLARRHDNPGLLGFARWFWAANLMQLGARDRARAVVSTGIDELTPAVQLVSGDTLTAEMLGQLHGMAAWIAARLGERNGIRRHFGPTLVRMWRLDDDVELGEGGRAYAELTRTPLDVTVLGSQERTSALHLTLACALTQDGPDRDPEVIRHLDTADRLAPQRIRINPVARDLVAGLDRRARRRIWELDSLCNRFGIGRSVHHG